MDGELIKRPSALIPMAMSIAALGVVLTFMAIFGVARQQDEGAAAHVWQLLMAGQIPVVAFFAVKWLPKRPRQGMLVLGLQVCAAILAMFPVWWLRW